MSNAQKTPFQQSLVTTIRNEIHANEGQSTGYQLPCRVVAVNGAIVTVNFEVQQNGMNLPPATMPIAQSLYVRLPVQVGDLGVCLQASTRLGGISGLGMGLAPLSAPGNLGGLVFVPIGNANWSPALDPNAVHIAGPNGAVIMTPDGKSTVTISSAGITLTTIGGDYGPAEIHLFEDRVTMRGYVFMNGQLASKPPGAP